MYLLKEFQRLKQQESTLQKLEWSVSRTLAKVNYRIHTDAIKNHLIPVDLSQSKQQFIYAGEADLLNLALFGKTAIQARNENQQKTYNLRDSASLEQLVVLSNMESYNAELIKLNLSPEERLAKLNQMAIDQIRVLLTNNEVKFLDEGGA